MAYSPYPEEPGIDPALKDLRSRQAAQAIQFRQNAPNMAAQQHRQNQSDVRRALSQRHDQITQNHNRRGTLYSGLRQGDQQRASVDASRDLAAANLQSNQQMEQIAGGLEAGAMGSAYGAAQGEAASANSALQRALADRQRTAQNKQALIGGLGSVGGMVIGGAMGGPAGAMAGSNVGRFA